MYITFRQIGSLKHHLNFSGNNSAMLQLLQRLHKYRQLSPTRNSFTQSSELKQCKVNKLAHDSKWQQKHWFKPGITWWRLWYLNHKDLLHGTSYLTSTRQWANDRCLHLKCARQIEDMLACSPGIYREDRELSFWFWHCGHGTTPV